MKCKKNFFWQNTINFNRVFFFIFQAWAEKSNSWPYNLLIISCMHHNFLPVQTSLTFKFDELKLELGQNLVVWQGWDECLWRWGQKCSWVAEGHSTLQDCHHKNHKNSLSVKILKTIKAIIKIIDTNPFM